MQTDVPLELTVQYTEEQFYESLMSSSLLRLCIGMEHAPNPDMVCIPWANAWKWFPIPGWVRAQ